MNRDEMFIENFTTLQSVDFIKMFKLSNGSSLVKLKFRLSNVTQSELRLFNLESLHTGDDRVRDRIKLGGHFQIKRMTWMLSIKLHRGH